MKTLLDQINYLNEIKRLLKIIKKTNNKDEKIESLLYLGVIYDQLAVSVKNKKKFYVNKARACFLKVLKLKNKKYFFRVYKGLGTVYMHNNNYDKALFYYKKALNLDKNPMIYQDLGNLYRKKKQYGESLRYYGKAIDLVLKNKKQYKKLLSYLVYNIKQLLKEIRFYKI